MSQYDWDRRFLSLVNLVRTWSKDPNTQVGAGIINSRHRIVSVGFNGLPSGVNDKIPQRSSRPSKYNWYEHAERNAIYNAVGYTSLTGFTMYVSHFPCPDCARAIIQTGITVVKLPTTAPFFRGFDSKTVAVLQMFYETGVQVMLIGNKTMYRVRLKDHFMT